MYHSGYKKSFRITGFALVELLVSISILVLVIGAIMVKQGAFNSAVLLRSQAYDVALEARETQLFAVSIISDAGDYNNIYGLHFDKNNNTGYKIFRDGDRNSYFGTSEEFGQQGSLDSRFVIGDVRWVHSDGTETSVNNVSVLFERPNFDAKFFEAAAPGGELSNATAMEIDIRLKGTTGDTNGEVRTVEITRTGQISVQ
jgi:type II secretory pathway pseudopilin PulG